MTKLDGKKIIEDAKARVKLKQEKDGHMKNVDWKTVLTVIITLVAVGSLVGSFVLGMNYQTRIDNHIKSEVKSLTVSKQ